MNSAAIDVVGIGNAIVDVIAHAAEPFLAAEGLAKGAMTLQSVISIITLALVISRAVNIFPT